MTEMNAPIFKEGHNVTAIATIGAAILGVTLGFFGANYNTHYASDLAAQATVTNAQNIELREDRDSIIALKGALSNDENQLNGTKLDIKALEANLNTLVSEIGGLKSAMDGQTEAFHGLQKQVGDMDSWLRPFHPGLNTGH